MRKILFLILTTVLISSSLIAQQAIFERTGQIEVPTTENAGFGNMVTGVDFDGDGLTEVYAVNNMYDLGGAESVPRLYKFEWNVVTLQYDSVWSAATHLTAQNTWPAMTWGDWDGDGKNEIIFGPVNSFAVDNPTRIFVYETPGDGSDNMGVTDGSGGWLPNAKWTILPDSSVKEQCRPFRWEMTDIDNDGDQEIVFGSRRGDRRFGVIGVSDIPDNGDSTETWELEVSGLSDTSYTFGGGTIYDMVTVDSTVYLFHSSGDVTPVSYVSGIWEVHAAVVGAVPGGSWKSASVVDVDGDGTKEIMVAGWSTGDNKIYLLEVDGGTIVTHEIADASPLIGAKGRFYGGWAGDTDGDGNLDYVSGTRGATVNGMIYQLSYKGGDKTLASSYSQSVIDQDAFDAGRWGLLHLADLNADGNDEVIYGSDWKGNDSGVPPYRVPLTILNYRESVDFISTATADNDGDFIPDTLDAQLTVSGVVLNNSLSGSRLQVVIQDYTGGIQLFSNAPRPDLKIGDRVIAIGKVIQFRGLNELEISNPATDISVIDTGFTAGVANLSIEEYLADAEKYEGTLVKITGVTKTDSSNAWPSSGSDANLTLWRGVGAEVTARVDKDTDVDEGAEPTWPISFTGIATQFSFDTPADNGYQVTLVDYAGIEQDVAVAPLSNFNIVSPPDGLTFAISDTTQDYFFNWNAAQDLNGGKVVAYQLTIFPDFAFPAGDTTVVVKGADLLATMGGADTAVVKYTVFALDPEGVFTTPVASIDTFSLTLINKVPIVGVEDEIVPNRFFVEQNYPNPFNPTTKIKFGLPAQSVVDLRIYDILGREVRTLVNNKALKAGTYSYNFDASALASGTYIYRLTTENNVVSKKMLLLK